MSTSIEKAREFMERSKRCERRQKLLNILNLILDGKIDSSKTPLARIFNQQGPRQQYVSPKDRGMHNSGYMEIDEMLAGTPFFGES